LRKFKISELARQNSKDTHLIVLVHGFQGNSEDLRLFRNNISLLFPTAIFLNSSSNEENTNANIEDLGYNLANEINNFISSNYESIEGVSKISFIGHSLGGVIIRTAI